MQDDRHHRSRAGRQTGRTAQDGSVHDWTSVGVSTTCIAGMLVWKAVGWRRTMVCTLLRITSVSFSDECGPTGVYSWAVVVARVRKLR